MSHRSFLALAFACLLFVAIPTTSFAAEKPAAPIRVVVWDEQQPKQKQAYDNFLGNAIADHLKAQPGLVVRSMNLDDGQQGLSEAVLNYAQVIVWWGRVHLPNCCFPGYRPDGKPSFLNTKLPDHPIAKGIPRKFQVAGTEMYNEPFHVPAPDQVVFEERWPTGEWFRSGAVWNIGRGKIFYFRPGHETYPVYKQKIPLQIVENAVRWMAAEQKRSK